MINEPTAASLAYGYQSKGNVDKNIIVIDFGGGTLDITLLKYKKDKDAIYCNVQKTYGDTNFGGEDFDKILMEKFKEMLCLNKSDSLKFFNDKSHTVRLKRACERAKIKLSDFDKTEIYLENYVQYKSFHFTLEKSEFIKYCKELFIRFEKILDDFLQLAKMNKNDISEVILIGGSTLIPKIKDIVTTKFNNSKINCHLNPKEVVAMGAAIKAAKFCDLPSVKEIKLFDVVNLPLGVREEGDKFCKLIERNEKIPCGKIKQFSTPSNNITSIRVEVYEGEHEKNCLENNLLLGKFNVKGLPKKKAGEVKILVKFEVKDNLILEVKAWEKGNEANSKQIKIEKINDLDINMLSLFVNQISFVENEEYNNIKLSIIESEESIKKEKNQKKKIQNL